MRRSIMAGGGSARRSPAARALSLVLALLLPLSGCYRSAPLQGRPDPGMRIMAGVTREGAAALEDQIGRDVVRVEGMTGVVTPEAVELRLINTWDALGREVSWNREAVTFPREYLHTMQQRELDKRRTWLTAGVITAAVVILGRVFFQEIFDSNEDDGKVVPPQ